MEKVPYGADYHTSTWPKIDFFVSCLLLQSCCMKDSLQLLCLVEKVCGGCCKTFPKISARSDLNCMYMSHQEQFLFKKNFLVLPQLCRAQLFFVKIYQTSPPPHLIHFNNDFDLLAITQYLTSPLFARIALVYIKNCIFCIFRQSNKSSLKDTIFLICFLCFRTQMNHCTKFAPLWMKFSNISLPPGTNPPIPLKLCSHGKSNVD